MKSSNDEYFIKGMGDEYEEYMQREAKINENRKRIAELNKPFEHTEFVATTPDDISDFNQPENDGCLYEAGKTGLKVALVLFSFWLFAWHPSFLWSLVKFIGYGCLIAAIGLAAWIGFCLWCRKKNNELDYQELKNTVLN